LNESDEQMNH